MMNTIDVKGAWTLVGTGFSAARRDAGLHMGGGHSFDNAADR
jgi:hypothetical protein